MTELGGRVAQTRPGFGARSGFRRGITESIMARFLCARSDKAAGAALRRIKRRMETALGWRETCWQGVTATAELTQVKVIVATRFNLRSVKGRATVSKSTTTLKAIGQNLETMMDDVDSTLKTAGGTAYDEASEALSDTARALTKTARAMSKSARKYGKRAGKKAAKAVKQHPIAAAALAASAAALVGALLVARRKSVP